MRFDDEEINEYGCPIHNQTGAAAIKNFTCIISRLSPELRAAFEYERAARQAELEHYFHTIAIGQLKL